MHKRILKSALTIALFISVSAITATAQDKISPEKRALIKEMIVVTDIQKASDSIMKALDQQLDSVEPQRIAESVNAMPDLTPQEREEMIREQTEDSARFRKRFQELTREKLNLPQLMEQLMYSIVDKYYTEDDLKSLIVFYKSPVGRKMLETMPQMMTDIILRSNEIIRPKLEEISKQILDEEKKRLQK
ncbi:MAG: DUF2059 domain-containing protein [Acidobacteria bacterium]|nr:DUF2059 domain-containing protein [Acidobacteriota bacterium]